jgi:PadR family transcriptional regulator, regulatory protein PadR
VSSEEQANDMRLPFPVEVVFAFPDAGYEGAQETAARYLTAGRVYTVRSVEVGQSSTYLELYEVPRQRFSSVYFAAHWEPGDEPEPPPARRLPRMTLAVQLILCALLNVPDAEVYGLEIRRATGVSTGVLYPALARLAAAGWVTVREEAAGPAVRGRPSRRYYRLTPDGLVLAREAVNRATAQLAALGVKISNSA